MQKAKTHHPGLDMDRIYTSCHTHTATGRVTLREPNIQNIPRDFEISITKSLLEKALGKEEAESINKTASMAAESKSLLFSYVEVSLLK